MQTNTFSKNDTNIVKGLAILMMMLHHCFISGRYEGYDISFLLLGEYYTVMLASFCKICVSIFVFLSGYGITISLMRLKSDRPDALKAQIKKRYFSLMSGFWIIYVLGFISALIIQPDMLNVYEGKNFIDSIFFALVDFMGLSKLFGTPTLIGTWWYMSLAIIIVAVMPLFFKIYKKFGAITLIVIIFCINGFFKAQNYDMFRWLFTLCLGIICADGNLLAKWKQFKFVKKHAVVDYVIKLVVFTAGLILCIYVRDKVDYTVSYLRDGIIPVYVIFYCYAVLADIPVLNKVLEFLGKHSMNIFLSHTFLRAYYLKDFIYSFKYPFVVVAVLTVLSVLISIAINFIKKYTCYNKLCSIITGRITQKA